MAISFTWPPDVKDFNATMLIPPSLLTLGANLRSGASQLTSHPLVQILFLVAVIMFIVNSLVGWFERLNKYLEHAEPHSLPLSIDAPGSDKPIFYMAHPRYRASISGPIPQMHNFSPFSASSSEKGVPVATSGQHRPSSLLLHQPHSKPAPLFTSDRPAVTNAPQTAFNFSFTGVAPASDLSSSSTSQTSNPASSGANSRTAVTRNKRAHSHSLSYPIILSDGTQALQSSDRSPLPAGGVSAATSATSISMDQGMQSRRRRNTMVAKKTTYGMPDAFPNITNRINEQSSDTAALYDEQSPGIALQNTNQSLEHTPATSNGSDSSSAAVFDNPANATTSGAHPAASDQGLVARGPRHHARSSTFRRSLPGGAGAIVPMTGGSDSAVSVSERTSTALGMQRGTETAALGGSTRGELATEKGADAGSVAAGDNGGIDGAADTQRGLKHTTMPTSTGSREVSVGSGKGWELSGMGKGGMSDLAMREPIFEVLPTHHLHERDSRIVVGP